MAGFFDKLKQKLFNTKEETSNKEPKREKPQQNQVVAKSDSSLPTPDHSELHQPATKPIPVQASHDVPGRDPYFVQLGLDFGTAFCKCICRDIVMNRAWVYIPVANKGNRLPFLMTSVVLFDGEKFQYFPDTEGAYRNGGLHQLKMALEKVGLEDWDAPDLQPYRAASRAKNNLELGLFIEACGVYLLSGIIGNVRMDLSLRFPGQVRNDYMPVNMAVPVSDADHPGVNACFDRILKLAWLLADKLQGHPPTLLEKLSEMIGKASEQLGNQLVQDACYIYPEVSANVQAFVRGRASREGFYLFSDTGAGTVDQSLFRIVPTSSGTYHLSYYQAQVLPLGSSHIEQRAAEEDGNSSLQKLDHWRTLKEKGDNSRPLNIARTSICSELASGTLSTVAKAKKYPVVGRKINEIKVIFGGGGHCSNPYRNGVVGIFNSNLFVSEKIEKRKLKGDTFDVGMPTPPDLTLKKDQRHWLKRLTVAYGLSFERDDLATCTLPGNLPDLETDDE